MCPTVCIVLYNTLFTSSLRREISRLAPLVDAEAVIAARATRFRRVVASDDIPSVVQTYSNNINNTFFLVADVGGLAILVAYGTGWRDVREKDATK
jgi:hypothetical protein